MANVEKFNTMTCQPGVICMGTSKEGVEGTTYREHLLWGIPCPECGLE